MVIDTNIHFRWKTKVSIQIYVMEMAQHRYISLHHVDTWRPFDGYSIMVQSYR